MMRAPKRAGVLLALLVGPAACGRSWGCASGETTYETLDGKVKVELVRTVRWSGGKVGGPMSSFSLRVSATPPFDHPIPCDHVDMAEDDAGKTIAWRCEGETEWNLLRLHGERHLVDCRVALGAGKKPDFARVEPLSRAADRIAGCVVDPSSDPSVWEDLAIAVEAEEGAPAAAEVLTRFASRPLRVEDTDPWSTTLLARSDAVRSSVLAAVCPALVDGHAPMPRYVRAAEHCPLDPPGVGPAAVEQLGTLLVRPVAKVRTDAVDPLAHSHAQALAWAGALAMTKEPARAGETACRVLDQIPEVDESRYGSTFGPWPRRTAFAVLASTRVPCPAARAHLEPPPCGDAVDCDAGLCGAAEVRARIESWSAEARAGLDGGVRARPGDAPPTALGLLGIAYAAGPLDKEIVVRNARRHYTFVDAGALPSCHDDRVDAGAPCLCDQFLPLRMCTLPSAETRAAWEFCALHVDDAKRRFDEVRRTCTADGGTCGQVPCCGGLACRSLDGGGNACVPTGSP